MSSNKFIHRHIGPRESEKSEMLKAIGVSSLEELIDQTIPPSIRLEKDLNIPEAMSEYEYLAYIREIGKKNKLFKSYIGQGYYNTISLSVIRRNILENPVWYTSYTPYQAEISQGRLEALLNFQTMVAGLTGMELANASLLDESTAAAEAMIMMYNLRSRVAVKDGVNKFFIDENVFPQTISVMETRANPLGIEIVKANYESFQTDGKFFGCLVQYPDANGEVRDYREFVDRMHKSEILVGVAADLMSLALLVPPGEWDADMVIGSTQRFGVPLGYGGPHAAYFATREKFKRNIPGRIIGVSVDRNGNQALRMALQTREQHIKREKATSNICTAQALLASMAGMYGVYHGPEGIKSIASEIHLLTKALAETISDMGYEVLNKNYFDTLKIKLPAGISQDEFRLRALDSEINFLFYDDEMLGLSLDETVNIEELNRILEVFAQVSKEPFQSIKGLNESYSVETKFLRDSAFMKEKVFNSYHSETELMRYIKKLERKDISLTHSMISLGSCTMKLNAAAELFAFLWPEFADIHPFVPIDQVEGYQYLFNELGRDLCEVTGFEAISFQPNSGAAGEYAGLMVIRAYHNSRNESQRNVVLIPSSAHGTNPASAVMAGMEVVVVNCDEKGNIDTIHLEKLAHEHSEKLAGFMITYPSTHGVFEEQIRKMIDIVHQNGGQVYMDGANMNAQVGLTNPGIIGADVCHLNLHKTFAIPHGGGGPGVGPIGVADHLVEFLPAHPLVVTGGVNGISAIAAAPYGSASILTISHAYIKMLGPDGLRESTKMAILNANYLAARLKNYYDLLYTGKKGRVGHEMILECRNFKQYAGISEADIAKRLMDFGFHAPTLSFPVHGTLMIEPTESESKAELDRFIESMISIYHEISEIHEGKMDVENNTLKNAPHTTEECLKDEWDHPYSRNKAAYPLDWIRENKFWPAVGRVDDAYGDRNLICTCAPLEAYKS
jgi:glycine cleavage system P protein (glycine dehydrogenase)